MKSRNFLSLVYISISLTGAHGFVKTNGDSVKLNVNSSIFSNYRSSVDYEQQQIHSCILCKFPGTYLDSMGIVINLVNDSLRNKLSITKTKDSITYLKDCLENALKDSMLLERLNKISIDNKKANLNFKGILTIYINDASNSSPVDSVAMDVFSGSRLLASAMSDSSGIIHMDDIPGGKYYIVFSRKGYAPVSLKNVTITVEGQSYMNISLSGKTSYIAQMILKNSWLLFIAGAIIFLFIMSFSAYYLAKFMSNRKNRAVK